MHDAITDKFGLLQSGNHAEDSTLFRPFQMRLEADQIKQGARRVVLAELYDRVGFAPVAGIFQADGFQRPVAHGVFAAIRHFFDGHTAFEDISLLKVLDLGRFRVPQRFAEGHVFFFRIKRAIQIGRLSLAIPGGPVNNIVI